MKAISWCSRHLDNHNLVLEKLSSRTAKARFEDAFFGELLNNAETIPALVVAYIKPDYSGLVKEVKGFVALGNKVNGWPGVCHGGVVATVLDEVPTMLTRLNTPGRSFMTAFLNVKYLQGRRAQLWWYQSLSR